MTKNILISIGIMAVAFGAGFGGVKIYSNLASFDLKSYLPASVGLTALQPIDPPDPSLTLTFAGDVMLDRGVKRNVDKYFDGDFGALFREAEALFQNDDITFLNLEGPVSDKGYKAGSIYSFRMNPAVLPVMKAAGVDTVSFANNHVGDYTKAAFTDTMARLRENEIPFSGAGDNYAQAIQPTIIEKNEIKVGYLAFTDVGPNWLAAKEKSAGILLASDPRLPEIIATAKTQVDVLVTSFHWGDEYKPHNARQTKLAHAAIDAGADIVAGHHPHVAQDIEMYKGKLIIYSLGNFIFDQYFSEDTMRGLVVQTKVTKNPETGAITISDTKEYVNQLSNFYAIESITDKNPPQKTSDISTEISIGWVGDIPPSTTLPKFDEDIVSLLSTPDLMIGNLEGALVPTANAARNTKCGSKSTNCYSFAGLQDFAITLAESGFDFLNLANNHAFDKGASGSAVTRAILTRSGLNFTPEDGTRTVAKINDVDVAFIGFGHNDWTSKITDLVDVKSAVRNAASEHSLVVVLFHGGAEGESETRVPKKNESYIGENRGNVYAFAHAAIDAGADLVLGSGPHVVRGIEKYKDRLIVYSAGNFLTTTGMKSSGLTGKGAIFTATVDQNGALKSLNIISTSAEIKNQVTVDSGNIALKKILDMTKLDFNQNISADENGDITFE